MNERAKIRARLRATTSCLALAMVWSTALGPAVDAFGAGPVWASVAHADSCCFVGETPVVLADGSSRPIRDIRPGERVLGGFGRINRVRAVEAVRLGDRALFGFNGSRPFFTAEHPFHTPGGWKALDPEAAATEAPGLRIGRLEPGDLVRRLEIAVAPVDGAAALQPGVVFALTQIHWFLRVEAPAETLVFNLLLDGDNSYVANGYLVHNKGDGDGGDHDGGGNDGGDGGDHDGGDNDGGGDHGDDSPDDGGDDGSEDHDSDDGADRGSDGGAGGGDRFFRGSAEPAGPDLSTEEERELISRGWR